MMTSMLCILTINACSRWKKYLFHHAHKRLMWDAWRKTKKKFVCQQLRVTPKSWHPNAGCSFGIFLFFVLFSTWACLTQSTFSSFYNVFHAFAGRNTQQLYFNCIKHKYPICLTYKNCFERTHHLKQKVWDFSIISF